ncbi:MAG: DEAD/DEAH box helicase family protein [Candidatus Liptonbacteria bacterium]|nr:DEAD/DEAH box helicase family protein [Candidatus Liptonbacteria bacterium]
MELKDYQIKTLEQLKHYLEQLNGWRTKAAQNPELEIDFPAKAWEKAEVGKKYHSHKNGIGNPLPNFCLKIPTGGGKTLLAVKAIDLINTTYLKKRTGLILWIVPTTQIYNQTIRSLRDREHPYRQHLDIASGGRTTILEKTDRFVPLDINENLVVLILMLPSASRQNKETLRMFKDNGGFQDFFPPEDNIKANQELLKQIPNLNTYGEAGNFWEYQIKTSLGNTLRLLNPLIILDEGHKAYSETAQSTLRSFNPLMILELSATPPEESNILVDIRGAELNQEGMIKLDLHIINKASTDWKDTLLAAVNHRGFLEEKAQEYEANKGAYIRPIVLIQVERTGKDQRDSGRIHAEDVREFLIKTMGIPAEQIATKTSEKDELKEVDDVGGLLSRDCQIRYIITKQALQEGWDCPFAYVLTILSNPTSQNALTQLVGRILRQPFARKTKVKELDESYVFCYQQRASALLSNIRSGFEQEGLGDLAGQVVTDEGLEGSEAVREKNVLIREKFKKAVSQIILPVFVMQDGRESWVVNYERDIASRIDWNEINIEPMYSLPLSLIEEKDIEQIVSLATNPHKLIEQQGVKHLRSGALKLDEVFLARHLLDIVPNPWLSYKIGALVLKELIARHNIKLVANNFVFVIEELRKLLSSEKNRLSKQVFQKLLDAGRLKFLVIGNDLGFKFPKQIKAKTLSRPLLRNDGQPLQRSLFEFVAEDEFNKTEKAVAWYLEDQDKLFFWFRNVARSDYAIQGWKKQKVYPDFIFSVANGKVGGSVFIIETKGVHLKNEDTDYKKSLFEVCNKMADEKKMSDLGLALQKSHINFQVIFENEWRRKFNSLFNSV